MSKNKYSVIYLLWYLWKQILSLPRHKGTWQTEQIQSVRTCLVYVLHKAHRRLVLLSGWCVEEVSRISSGTFGLDFFLSMGGYSFWHNFLFRYTKVGVSKPFIIPRLNSLADIFGKFINLYKQKAFTTDASRK